MKGEHYNENETKHREVFNGYHNQANCQNRIRDTIKYFDNISIPFYL